MQFTYELELIRSYEPCGEPVKIYKTFSDQFTAYQSYVDWCKQEITPLTIMQCRIVITLHCRQLQAQPLYQVVFDSHIK